MADGFTLLREEDVPNPQPPSNIEAEQALLGAILVNNVAYGRVCEFLAPEHFVGNSVHGRIFAAIGKLIERGEIATPVTLKNLFDQDGALADIGGAQYLARLAESAVTIINAEHYGRTIHELHLRRELITVGQDVISDAFRHDLDDPATAQIERAEQKLYALATSGQIEGGPRPAVAAMDAALGNIDRAYKTGKVTGLPTGLIDLDKLLGGLYPGDLIIVGGATSMGKTALATGVADFNARERRPVLFFELEMTSEQLAQRLFAARTGISVQRQRNAHQLTQDEIDQLVEARSEYPDLLHIDDSARSLTQVYSRARRHKRRFELGLVVVDYLQLLHIDRRPENRVQEVSIITRGLKAIAMDLAVPVLALSQLSREVGNREEKRPRLQDLRDSGSLEQDADTVIFTHREAYYVERAEPHQLIDESEAEFSFRLARWGERLDAVRGLAELIIAKNRHGEAPHTVTVHFDGERTSFGNHSSRGEGK